MKMIMDRTYRNAYTTAFLLRCSSMMTGFIDGVFTSTFLGAEAMTAYGISTPYFMLNNLLSYTLITGCQVLCTSKIGKNRTDEAGHVFSTALWILLALSALLGTAGVLFAEPFAGFLGARGEAAHLAPLAAGYLRYLFIGGIFHNFSSVASGVLQMDGGAKIVRVAGITVCVADIVGDLLNVFVFRGGLAGMGLATMLSYVCYVIVLIPYFFRRKKLFSLSCKQIRFQYVPELLHQGFSQTVYGIASFLGNTAINRLIIAKAGLDAMLGMTVFKNLALFVNPFCVAVGDAVLILMGLRIGDGDRDGIDRILREVRRSILWIVALGLLVILFSRPLAQLYTADDAETTIRCVCTAVTALGIQLPFTALFLAALKGMQAFRRSAACSVMNLAKACLFPCGLLLIFARDNAAATFGALAGAEILAAVLTAILFLKEKRKSPLLAIPEENIISADISTDAGAVEFSELASAFCKRKGLNSRLRYFVPLCAEELSICLIGQGMENKVKDPSVHVKILLCDQSLTMSFRDNSPRCDLLKRAEEWSLHEDRPERFIGTRMALKLADGFRYIPLMDQNNTMITFNLSKGETA